MRGTRYNGATRSYVTAPMKEGIAPAAQTKVLSDIRFINGGPFGPFNPDAPIVPESRSQAGYKAQKAKGYKSPKRLDTVTWKDTKSTRNHH